MPSLTDTWTELEHDLPPVVLLQGLSPDTGMAMAVQLARQHVPADASIIAYAAPFSASQADEVAAFARLVQFGVAEKVVVIELDNATFHAQNRLLRVLEAPPPGCRFILIASRDPLSAVVSRSRVYRIAPEEPSSGGMDGEVIAAVEAAIKAASECDPGVLCAALRSWADKDKGERYLAGLSEWARKTGDGSWDEVLTRRAFTVLYVLAKYPRARPQNLAMTALSLAFLEEL